MYTLTSNPLTVIRDSDNAYIPFDNGNSDYKEYLAWITAGNTPAPYVAPPVPISDVSPRQLRQALTKLNLRIIVETAINAADQDTKDWYQFATYFDRANPHVTLMGTALGVTSAQLDQLWQLAATL